MILCAQLVVSSRDDRAPSSLSWTTTTTKTVPLIQYLKRDPRLSVYYYLARKKTGGKLSKRR